MNIDLSRFKVVYGEKVLNAISLQDCFFDNNRYPNPDDKGSCFKPKFLSVMVINEDGNIVVICDEAWMFQFREKLVELLLKEDDVCEPNECKDCGANGSCYYHRAANRIIANGVTVQEEAKLYWKPVEPGKWNLTCSACDSHLGCREGANFCPECGAKFVYPKAVAPQPPKGE